MVPGGTGYVVFDADGSLIEVNLPCPVYGSAPKRATPPKLDVAIAGLKAMPQGVGERLALGPSDATVSSLHCGYYDDGEGATLQAGCFVGVMSNQLESGREQKFVPAK